MNMSKPMKTKLLTKIKLLSAVEKAVIVLSLIVFLLSLTQPAFYVARKDNDAWANTPFLLFFGWIGFLGGGWESIFWLANPAYFLAIYLHVKGSKRAVYFASAAFIIAACFSLLTDIISSESGARARITSFEPGYELWVVSLALLAVGITVTRIRLFLLRPSLPSR